MADKVIYFKLHICMSSWALKGEEMKKLLLTTVIFILYGICFSGCTRFFPEEDLVVYTTRTSTYYEYQEKIAVVLRYSDKGDVLTLRTDETSESWMSMYGESYEILSGEFEKVGWYDDNLFILMDGTYYSIDIDEYEIAPIIKDEDDNLLSPEYELKEYSEGEFKELYPAWEYFDWYGH